MEPDGAAALISASTSSTFARSSAPRSAVYSVAIARADESVRERRVRRTSMGATMRSSECSRWGHRCWSRESWRPQDGLVVAVLGIAISSQVPQSAPESMAIECNGHI